LRSQSIRVEHRPSAVKLVPKVAITSVEFVANTCVRHNNASAASQTQSDVGQISDERGMSGGLAVILIIAHNSI